MKRIMILIAASMLMVSFAANNSYAKAIGIKGGYVMPKDANAEYDNTWLFGLYFDMGSVLINSLDFRPGIDYFVLKNHDSGYNTDVYGIHFDWYWFFLDKQAISPFLGFGPTLNYYDWDDDDHTQDSDSDAGVDLFLGAEMKIGGTPFGLMVEGRFKMMDIANRDQNAWCINLGLSYNF